ncbi:flagellar hook-length control protein FliK [Sphingomonas hengshuiensis]|uniref:flagellar hook-length control protein FliK n=1 Tax=Sphingomonas hengshuiensis TaxID=1609977 RepID=UPI00138E38D0|nr:flagellar hook-length control protein FliK [Sphingomonas hengshuiensis]
MAATRQRSAAPGKDLPQDDAASPEDEADPSTDIAFAWFAMPIAPDAARPTLVAPGLSARIAPPGGDAAPVPALAGEAAAAEGTAPAATVAPEAGASAETLPVPELQPMPDLPEAAPTPPARAGAPHPAPAPTQPAADPATSAPVLTTVAALAAPLFQALAEPAAPRRAQRDPLATAPLAALDATAATPAIAPAAQTQDGTLDLRRQEWTGQMIERIEALRDAGPVRETRIRLAPDALGTVDVSIRNEGDRVHVRFAADTPAARQALADAQPRLADLAEARGLRLGQTSVDSGGAGQGNAARQQWQETPPPLAPRAASASADTASTDDRIA